MFFTALQAVKNRILSATLTSHALIVELYRLTTKSNSDICEGQLMEGGFAKAGVISGQFCQVSKNNFLPFSQNEDVVSPPLKA